MTKSQGLILVLIYCTCQMLMYMTGYIHGRKNGLKDRDL